MQSFGLKHSPSWIHFPSHEVKIDVYFPEVRIAQTFDEAILLVTEAHL